MALGFGEGGDQVSPLGIAVIGGLLFGLISSLVILPVIYNTFIGNRELKPISLDPDDEASKYYYVNEQNIK
jgi:Cu/Ag efflux pump CusA